MKLWRSIKNHLLPWRGNTHRPHILRRGWLLSFLALALVCEGVIVSQTLAPGPNVFLAAVVKSDLIAYTEAARMAEGSGVLLENNELNAAAQAKAEDMAAKGYFSHVGPGGEEPWAWIERSGYDYVYAGENLAVRFNDSKDVVNAWMASPTHRANIVKPQYEEIGVGIAEGMYKGGPATFVVQYFGSPARAAVAAAPADEADPLASTHAAAPAVAGAETQAADAAVSPAPVPPPSPESSFTQPLSQAHSLAHSAGEVLGSARPAASWILGGIAAFLAGILALTFFVRIQVQPTDLLKPGLAVALVAITFLTANAKILPAATQSASAAGSLPGDVAGGAATERVSAFPEAPAAEPSNNGIPTATLP
jgi:hypothetical protein